jgi:23S rRNA pseudouridine1911/1915/1917 synthase
VHRLDRGASGLVLFTIRSIANKSLHKQFVEHAIRRTYRVRVRGDLSGALVCATPLVEDRTGGMRPAAGHSHGKPARTRFVARSPALALPGTSLVEVELETGRTHQIRVHAAVLGLPVVGDHRYGREDDDDDGRLMLHAWRLGFAHPRTGALVEVESAAPDWGRADDD